MDEAKLAIKLYDSGEEVGIASLSSGEYNRVNTATLLAVRKMLSSLSKVNINILFLDEVVSVLDQHGKDILIELLLSEPDLNSFVVSHGYVHPLADKIELEKVGTFSRIVE
jgi:energy-coupling factor transporter ATP-binding protein EcfA2